MNDLKKIVVLTVISLIFSFTLGAQDLSSKLQIKDTTELRNIINLALSEVKETKHFDQKIINSILRSALVLKDTSTYFYFYKKLETSYLIQYSATEDAIQFIEENKKLLGPNQSPYGDFNNSLGNFYKRLKFYSEALECYFKSVEWFEKFQNHNTTIPLGNIAAIYFDNKNFEKALEYNKSALNYSLKLTKKADRLYNLTYDYYRIGSIYYELQQNKKATLYHKMSLNAAREHQTSRLIILSLSQSVGFYNKIGDYMTCDKLIAEGDSLLKNSSLDGSSIEARYTLTKSQYYLNSGQFSKAVKPENISNPKEALSAKILEYAGSYYTQKKDFNKAIQSYETLLDERQKVERENRMNALSNIEDKFNNKKLIVANKKLATDISKRKRVFTITIVSLLLISSLFILQLFNNRKHKKLNNLLKIKTKDLEKSNEELERFAFIASHDLKTPLRDIVSFTNLLEIQFKSSENKNVHEYLSFIKKGGLRLDNLINQTLEYSKLSFSEMENRKEAIDLNILIAEIEQSLFSYIKERNANIIILNNLPKINTHHRTITTLFRNLIENGIQYNESSKPTIKLSVKENPTTWSIFIRDNGIGIPKEYHDKIFVMFSRLHNQQEYTGSGLGLSICKKTIENLNGKIHIQSHIEKGSVFELQFPKELVVPEKVITPRAISLH